MYVYSLNLKYQAKKICLPYLRLCLVGGMEKQGMERTGGMRNMKDGDNCKNPSNYLVKRMES